MIDAPPAVVEQYFPPELPAPAQAALTAGPYNFEFTGEDTLRLTVYNSLAGVSVGVHWRIKRPDGLIVPNREVFTPSSDRAATHFPFTIGKGHLLNVVTTIEDGSPRRGQTYARLRVMRGQGNAGVVMGALVQGYCTAGQDRAWPGSPLEGPLEGDGYVRELTGSNPAAGVEVSETVPTGARWEVLSGQVFLVTSAAAANRRPHLIARNIADTDYLVASPAPTTLGASNSATFVWLPNLPLAAALGTDFVNAGLPTELVLLAGQRLGTYTNSLQAGDNYAAPLFQVREWLEAQ